MFVFNTSSWHYRLVYFVFGESFFFQESLDHEKIRKERLAIDDKTRKEFPNDDNAIEKAHHDFNMNLFQSNEFVTYTTKKIVNFCPYCRAVVTSLILFPFTAIYKLIPKRKPRRLSLEESKRKLEMRSKIVRGFCGALNITLGLKNLLIDGSVEVAIFQFALGLGVIFLHQSAVIIGKIYHLGYSGCKKVKKLLVTLHILKEVKKVKAPKSKEPKTPNFVQAFFSENHEKYCPPVRFVDGDMK